jgi:very-short-patch-repair endonuclease
VVVLGSVYAEKSTRLTDASMAWAAALTVGTEGVVSHVTAARLWGLRVPVDPEVHVIVPRDARLRISGVRAHRIELADADTARVSGVECTGLIRTAVDCLLWLPEEAGRGLMTDAMRRRILEPEQVREHLRSSGLRHGLTRAWSVLTEVGRGAHSEAEVLAHRILRRAGIQGWEANAPIHDEDGLIGIADLLFRVARVVVEIDGRAYHSDDAAFQRDRARQNRLVAAGFQVLRFTWDDLVSRPEHCLATLRPLLEPARRRQSAVVDAER